ncbi:nitrilase-related carbon-nitrogen hydrolase [Azospirillum picis]|uniref:Amidohydrolase n=1 Tax=Azospirillum picis TaxID=488438 RepID=A0ABU0MJP2_9PROT|nr:nitrilase-related carbon-nitrogen hydrolase [Azospirillum picis]MBP2299790.1 putative amidohydrolase [Azospirillum picis]MDQ0533586.1 putative amidohydrolase [Azospirillum picis]
MHPADLFIGLWRRLTARRDEVRSLAGRLEADPERAAVLFDAAAERLRDGAASLETWVLDPDARGNGEADGGADGGAPPLDRVLAAAQAIDAWFMPFAAWYAPAAADLRMQGSAAPDGAAADLLEARRRYNRDGRFNADPADGQLILRPGLLARAFNVREAVMPSAGGCDDGFDPVDLFRTLLVVPPTLAVGADRDGEPERRITMRFQRLAGLQDQVPADPDWRPVIGVVPLLQAEDDLDIHRFERDGETWYDPLARPLARRAADAVATLAEQGATIVLFPEVSAHPETLAAISEALRRQAVDGSIRYALVGVRQQAKDGGRPRNRALLLDRRGREIAGQTKLHCWDLDSNQCRSYDLRDRNGRLLDCAREDIETGSRFTLFELPGFGRLAIAICEDLGRSQPSAWIASAMAADWLVTPVMDSGLTTGRWQAKEGAASSRTGYCRVIVANSMALSHRFNRYCRANGEEDMIIHDCGVALLFQPRADEAAAPRIDCLTLPLADPAPGYVCSRWTPDRWQELPEPEEAE